MREEAARAEQAQVAALGPCPREQAPGHQPTGQQLCPLCRDESGAQGPHSHQGISGSACPLGGAASSPAQSPHSHLQSCQQAWPWPPSTLAGAWGGLGRGPQGRAGATAAGKKPGGAPAWPGRRHMLPGRPRAQAKLQLQCLMDRVVQSGYIF